MKKLLIAFLLISSVALSSAADYETPGDGVQEGDDVTFGNMSVANLDVSGNFSGGVIKTDISNTGLGTNALNVNNGGEVVAIGANALTTNQGDDNTAIGFRALQTNISGTANTGIGKSVMVNNDGGDYNVSIGAGAMFQNTEGSSNSVLGYAGLFRNLTGNNNVSIGSFAGYSSVGNGNIFLGYRAGIHEKGSNTFYIDNSDTTTPLIYGNFSTNEVIINGSLSIPTDTTVFTNYSVTTQDYTVFANATTTGTDMYLPDATTADGLHIRFKKKDETDNHITINAVGGQTIDGNGFKVLEQTNNAIMLYSNGSNWEVLQATSVAHYGEMHVHDNSTSTDISTADSPHLMQGLFVEEDSEGFTFVTGSTGPISAFAEYSTVVSGTTKVTDIGHGLSSGAILSISGTTSYNDVFEAIVIDSDNYYITDTFVADDATGNWYEGDKLVNTTGKTGKFKVEFHGFGTPQTNNDILEFHLYKDAVGLMPLESKNKFTSSTDVGAISASGLTTIADDEAITFSIINTSGTGDFTIEHVNVVIYSF